MLSAPFSGNTCKSQLVHCRNFRIIAFILRGKKLIKTQLLALVCPPVLHEELSEEELYLIGGKTSGHFSLSNSSMVTWVQCHQGPGNLVWNFGKWHCVCACVCSGVFVGLGLSGVVPTLHFVISEGLIKATTMGQMGWLLLMATLYITGACLYAARIPERFFPGKCDIWVSGTRHGS